MHSAFPIPSIEDIELGYRLRQAGHHILLDKTLQGTHLKRWTLRSIIETDVICRALPWARLILESHIAPDDLNLKMTQKISGALVGLACICLLMAVFQVHLLAVAVGACGGGVVLNRDLYRFFRRQRSLSFAIACLPLYWLYYLYSGLSYLYVWSSFRCQKARK